MAGSFRTFSLRLETLDRLKAMKPEDVTYSDFLDQLMDQEVESSPDGAWRRLALGFVSEVEKLQSR